VELLDYNAENITREKLKNYVLSSDAVGINVYSITRFSAAKISKDIKEIDSKIPLMIGGAHCILLKHLALSHIPHADISIACEGEHVIIDIIRFIQGKKNYLIYMVFIIERKTRLNLGNLLKQLLI
jgi:hypothetical protein